MGKQWAADQHDDPPGGQQKPFWESLPAKAPVEQSEYQGQGGKSAQDRKQPGTEQQPVGELENGAVDEYQVGLVKIGIIPVGQQAVPGIERGAGDELVLVMIQWFFHAEVQQQQEEDQ